MTELHLPKTEGNSDAEIRPRPPESQPGMGRAGRRRGKGGSVVVDLHNVLGVLAAAAIVIVSAAGVLLNHLEFFGITRPVPAASEQRPPLADVLSIPEIVEAAQAAEVRSRAGGVGEPAALDRATWRPRKGYVDVRLEGDPVTSVFVDDATAEVLDLVERHDLRVTAAHSGELIDKPWVILSDLVALALIVSVITGVTIWGRRVKRRRRLVGARAGGSQWIRANWWFHLVGGLTASSYLVVMSVTGILLNHKQPLGFMDAKPELPERGADFRPLPVGDMVASAIAFRASANAGMENVKLIDYRPGGYAKIRFDDDYELIVDAADGSIEKASRRWDVWIEDLHSGLLLGSRGWLVADISAVIAILLTINGAYLWTRPGWRARDIDRKGA